MDSKVWRVMVHGALKSWTRLSNLALVAAHGTFRVSWLVLVVKSLPDAGDIRDTISILRSGKSPGSGNGNLLQYPCLENVIDRGAWQVTVHGVAKYQT